MSLEYSDPTQLALSALNESVAASLKNGVHRFRLTTAHPGTHPVKLHLHGRKIVEAAFDLVSTSWCLGETAEVLTFCQDNADYWKRHPIPKGKQFIMPGPVGLAGMTFSVLKVDSPAWIARAAKILSDPKNLVSAFPIGPRTQRVHQ